MTNKRAISGLNQSAGGGAGAYVEGSVMLFIQLFANNRLWLLWKSVFTVSTTIKDMHTLLCCKDVCADKTGQHQHLQQQQSKAINASEATRRAIETNENVVNGSTAVNAVLHVRWRGNDRQCGNQKLFREKILLKTFQATQSSFFECCCSFISRFLRCSA